MRGINYPFFSTSFRDAAALAPLSVLLYTRLITLPFLVMIPLHKFGLDSMMEAVLVPHVRSQGLEPDFLLTWRQGVHDEVVLVMY